MCPSGTNHREASWVISKLIRTALELGMGLFFSRHKASKGERLIPEQSQASSRKEEGDSVMGGQQESATPFFTT